MILEAKESMAKMFSLMERMGRHSTLLESEYINESFMEDALGEDAQANTGVLKPFVRVSVLVDHKSQKKDFQIRIDYLSGESIRNINNQKLRSQFGIRFSGDESIVTGTNDVTLTKNLTYFIRNKRKKDDGTEQDAGDNAQPQASGDVGDLNVDDILSGLLKEGDFDDFDMDAMLADLSGDNSNQGDKQDNGSNEKADTSEVKDENDKKVLDFLNGTYKKCIDALMAVKNTNYDSASVQRLYDIPSIYSLYYSEKFDPEEARIYNEKTDSEIIEEIKKALSSGDYSGFETMITPLDIDSVIWGNQISARNATAILKQGAAYGFTPTMVHGASMWPKYYNRRLIPNARPLYGVINAAGRHNKKDSGSKGHFDTMGVGYKPMPGALYDISDTEVIDDNDKGDLHQTLPGLQNNITGEKNQAALDYIQKVKSQIPEDLLKKAEETDTSGGKAKIYNTILIKYCEKNGLSASLNQIDENADDNTALSTYISNIYKIASNIASGYNYAKQENTNRVMDALAFCIAYYTVGANMIKTSGNYQYTNIRETWNEEAQNIVSNIRVIFNYIRNEIRVAFGPLRDKIREILSAEKKANFVPDEENGGDDASAQTNDALNECDEMDTLINDVLMLWK